MQYEFDLDLIKSELTLNQIYDLLTEFHAEPIEKGDILVCKTICHNHISELDKASHKLYYYENSHLFRCYTACGDAFDVFELVRKVKTMETGNEWSLPQAVRYIGEYFGYAPKSIEFEENEGGLGEYWEILNAYDRIKTTNKDTKQVELKTYNESVIANLPKPRIIPWEKDGISKEVCDYHNICYNPKSCGIVIPHYDINDNLIGIRERTLIKENAELYGKYHPARINNKMYNHPLSFALYNLNFSKDNIKRIKKAIVFESEKSTLQYASMFGKNNDISVACCGSSLINYQLDLLLTLGVNEIIIAFDHDFESLKDDTAKRMIDKYKKMYIKYGNKVTLSFIWDREGLTDLKSSPTDHGKDIFLQLFQNRINLYE